MARKRTRFEPVSTPLEDAMPVNYQVVGTPEWFAKAFKPGSVLDSEKVEIRSAGDLAPIKQWVNRQRCVGADTETTGRIIKGNKGYSMNPVNKDTEVVLLQLGTKEKTYLIEPSLIYEFKGPLESTDILKLLQNALYDFKFLLMKYGIHMDRIYDTMLAEQVITAGLLGVRVGLADMARKYDPFYLISKAVRGLFIELGGGKMDRSMVYYAARDIPLMFPIMRAQMKELKAKLLEATAKLEFDCIPCTAEMELGGVYLIAEKLELLISYWLDKQADMEKQILEVYNEALIEKGIISSSLIPGLGEVFALNSGPQKLEALRMLGFELDDVKRDTLMAIDHPIAGLLGEYSNVTKWTSTYGENMRGKINEFSGMWHPRFAQMGSGEAEAGNDRTTTTATGRYASDAQQFPRKQDRYSFEKNVAIFDAVKAHFATEIEAAIAAGLSKAA